MKTAKCTVQLRNDLIFVISIVANFNRTTRISRQIIEIFFASKQQIPLVNMVKQAENRVWSISIYTI